MDLNRGTEVDRSAMEDAAGAAGIVLLTLASAQFLMTLDSGIRAVN
jgi:hypothetical protein